MNHVGQASVRSPACRPLVLIHGWGMHAGVWSGVVQKLVGRGEVLSLDLPGYGDAPGVSPYTLDILAEAVAAQCPDEFDVCAWSLGGLVAQRMVQRYPARIGRLVLVGSSPCFTLRDDWYCGIPAQTLIQFSHELEEAYEVTLKRFLALQVRGDAAAHGALSVLRAQLFARGRPAAEVLQQGLQLLLHTDLRLHVSQMTLPTLLIQGNRDQLTPLGAAQWLAQHAPNAHLRTVGGAAHAPFLSHEMVFVQVLEEFLAGDQA